MANNGKDPKHTRNFTILINCVRNGKDFNLYKKVWCEKGLQLVVIGTNTIIED